MDVSRPVVAAISAGIVVAGVIALALFSIPGKKEATSVSSVPSLPPKSSQATFPTSTSYVPYLNVSRGNRTGTATGLLINPCGELSTHNGAPGAHGTSRDPVIMHRGDGPVYLPICFRSDDPAGTSYSLTIAPFPGNPSAGYILEEPHNYGLQASLDKVILHIPNQTSSNPGSNSTVFDRAMLSLGASQNATLGNHVIGIRASKLVAGSTPETIQAVYLRIE